MYELRCGSFCDYIIPCYSSRLSLFFFVGVVGGSSFTLIYVHHAWYQVDWALLIVDFKLFACTKASVICLALLWNSGCYGCFWKKTQQGDLDWMLAIGAGFLWFSC